VDPVSRFLAPGGRKKSHRLCGFLIQLAEGLRRIREPRAWDRASNPGRKFTAKVCWCLPLDVIELAGIEVKPVKMANFASPNDWSTERSREPSFEIDTSTLKCEVGNHELRAADFHDNAVANLVIML